MREIGVGLRGFKIGPGLKKLLIDFGSIDVGEQFAFSDAGADVAVPLFEIAVGASVDGRFDVCLHGAGQYQAFFGRLSGGMDYCDGGDGESFGFFRQGLILRAPLEKCERAEDDEDNDRDEEQAEEPALLRLGRSVEFGCHKCCTFPC